jgi:phosphoribosylformimino-5-aminoimidazole carboxamide ribotide isomerase
VKIYPAIDLYGKKVVRLAKGDYTRMTEYGDDPLEWGRLFRDSGARWLHVIDLEGAQSGKPLHLEALGKLVGLGLRVQYGGGIRDVESIRKVLESGASRVLIGSLLLETERSPAELFSRFGHAVTPAIDIQNGRVALKGWTSLSGTSATAFTRMLVEEGFSTFLFTSIEKDGTLEGPDLSLYSTLRNHFPDIRIMAAGGISSLEDILFLKQAGVDGAVLGKSLYEGRINLKEALEVLAEC